MYYNINCFILFMKKAGFIMAILRVNLDNISKNYKYLQDIAKQKNMDFLPVTKVCQSDNQIILNLINLGARSIADCYLNNLLAFEEYQYLKKYILRLSPSSITNNLNKIDYIFLSDLKIAKMVNNLNLSYKPNIIVTLELGDMREGVNYDEIIDFIKELKKMDNITIAGIGSNLGCLAGRLADEIIVEKIIEITKQIKNRASIEPQIISLGGTVIYEEWINGMFDGIINQIRMGEAFFFGYNMSKQVPINELSKDTFSFFGEILEIRKKKVSFNEKIGYNAFGKKTRISDNSVRKQAVLDFGDLAAPLGGLTSIDNNINVIGATHDYTVIDLSETERNYYVGDKVEFKINYNSCAHAFLSPYVKKKYYMKGDIL